MDGDVQGVVTADVRAAKRVVELQRERDDRPAGIGQVARCEYRAPGRPERAQVPALGNGHVIKNEGRAETVGEHRRADDDQQPRRVTRYARARPAGSRRDGFQRDGRARFHG